MPRDNVVVIAATNYPDRVDSAMMRPGRLERHVVIPHPDVKEIEGMLAHHLKSKEPKSPADIMQVARDARRLCLGPCGGEVRHDRPVSSEQLFRTRRIP